MPDTPRIAIAIVEHAGRYLVGMRPPGVPLAGYAEFPGGKCQPGENTAAAAVRECFEETGLTVEPVTVLDSRTWDYPHGRVVLTFWRCRLENELAVPAGGFRWVPQDELMFLPFPPANATVLAAITEPKATRPLGSDS